MTVTLHRTQRRRGLGVIAIAGVVLALVAIFALRDNAGADPMEAVIFDHQFNVDNDPNVPGWNDTGTGATCGNSGSGSFVVDNSVRLRDNCAIVNPSISTADLEDIHLEYAWGHETFAEGDPGALIVEWKLSSEDTWLQLNAHNLPAQSSSLPGANPVHLDLPDEASDTFIDLRFRTTATGDNAAFIDFIRLSGNNIEVPDEDGDEVPDEFDLCPGTPPGADVNEDGCSIEDFISQLSPGTANGAISENVCDAADFSLVIDTSNSISESPELAQVRTELVTFINAYEAVGDGLYKITTFNNNAMTWAGGAYVPSQPNGAISAINSILSTTGETNTAAGINTGNVINAGGAADDIMFVITDGSPNLPSALPTSDPQRWIDAANDAIAAANAARPGFVVHAVFVPRVDSSMIEAFGSPDNAMAFAQAVMNRIGGGSHINVGNFGGIAEGLLGLLNCEEPEPETRDITIEKIVAGDEPPASFTAVSGNINPHSPSAWNIDLTSANAVTITEVSTAQQTVTETTLGPDWTIEYAVLNDASGDLCSDVNNWSTTAATVPAGEADYTVCIRNTYTAPDEPDPTRTIVIEKIVTGDTPPAPLNSVSGTISPHLPSAWNIDLTSSSTTTLTEVSTAAQTVLENHPGANWEVAYAVIAADANCATVDDWNTLQGSVPAGEADYRVCVRNTYDEPDQPDPTRSITIEKVVAGDTPPSPLNVVSGTINPHGAWSIDLTVTDSTTATGVSTSAQTVTETNPGANWTVEYALAESTRASCDEVVDWSTTPVNIPDGEADYKVCIRNTYTAPPSLEKTGATYTDGQARWTITVTNGSSRLQTVTITDPVAVNIVGGTPDGCSGNLASGLVCNVDSQSELSFVVYKLVTQQCDEQTVFNTARAYLGQGTAGTPLPNSPQENVPTTVPGDVDACEDLRITKVGLGWADGWAQWGITIDNSEQSVAHDVTINDPGAYAVGDVAACDLEDGDEVVDVDCTIEAGQVVHIQVRTEEARRQTCEAGTATNALTADSTPLTTDALLIFELEYSIFAIQQIPGNPDLCPATLTVQKYIGADRNADALLDGPQAGDSLANGWEIVLTCDSFQAFGTTGSNGAGTVVFELDEGAGECSVSETLEDGYTPIGFFRDDNGSVSSGVDVSDVDITLNGGDEDLVIFYNEETPDEPTPTPTATPTSTATPTATATAPPDATATPTATPTATATSPPAAKPTPAPPATGSGGIGGGALTTSGVVVLLLAIGGGVLSWGYARRKRLA